MFTGGAMMANETRFNRKSDEYKRFRPGYPDQLLKDIYKENNLNGNSVIADIGSGTGIMTKQLLNLGIKVFAVEPNEDMRMAANETLKEYKDLTFVDGSAEKTTLKDNCVDMVVVAQAFHWFDVESFRNECQRILKPDGKVAIISNERVLEDLTHQEIAVAYRKYSPNFKGFSNGLMGSMDLYDNFFAYGYSHKTYDNPLIYDKGNFIGRHLSSSFSLTKSDEFYPMLVEALSKIFDRHSTNGYLNLPNITNYRCGVCEIIKCL